MTEPFATAHVAAELDWNNLDEDLKLRVTAAAEEARKTLQEKLDKWSLNATVKLKPSIGDFRKQAREKLAGVTLVKDVELRTTATELNRWTNDLRERLKKKQFGVNVTPRLDMTELNARLANLPEATARVNLTVTAAERNRFTRWLREWLASADFQAPIHADLRNAAQFRALLEQLTHDRTVDVHVRQRGGLNIGSGAGRGGIGALNLGSLSRGTLIASGVAAAIAGIGGAAGAALGAVGALGVGLTSLGPAALAGAATAAVSLHGIKDAFKALEDVDDSSKKDAKEKAKAISDATDKVAASEKAVRDAKKDSKQAEQDLTNARKDAQKAARDLNLEVRGGVLSEKEAQLDLADARKELANLKPGDSHERAVLRVAQAEQRLLETRYRNSDLAEKKAESDAKGIEGSDLVTAAQDRLTKANERVEEAEKKHTEAVKELGDAQSTLSESQEKAARALEKLSPNARAFVLAMRDLKPMTKDLRESVQDAAFADLDKRFTALARATMPAVKDGMTEVATSMNGAAKQFAAFWSSAGAQQGIRDAFSGTASLITAMQPGLAAASQGFISFAGAAKPAMDSIGASIGGLVGSIGNAFTQVANSGALTQLFETFSKIIDGLGAGLGDIVVGLVDFGNQVGPTLGPLFAALGQSLAELAPSMGALGAEFVRVITDLLPILTPFIATLADGLRPLLPVLGELFGSLLQAVQPLIGPLSRIAQTVGNALVEAIQALAPSLGPIGEAFASLVSAVAPILPVLAEVASGILQALAPALTTIFNALGPVIQQWADLMIPVFRQLQPILADVAQQIGTAIADALNQIAPYLPDIARSFTGLVMALLPLLPQLVQLGVDLLPPLIRLFIAILPQVLKLIDAFTWLANNVLVPILIPAIKGLAQYLGDQLDAAAKAVTTARDFIGGALSRMGDFFRDLGTTVDTVWSGIVRGIAIGVKSIGQILQKVSIPDWVPGIGGKSAKGLGDSLIDWAKAHGAATGGRAIGRAIARYGGGGRLISGPGTGTSDSIPALLDGMMPLRVANGEFISTADAYKRGAPLLWALNRGWTPSPEFLRMMTGPGFAEGGLVSAKELVNFARGVEGADYDWGGVHWGDCSGAVSALANKATGRPPFGSRFATGNMGAALDAMGALPGLGPAGSLNFGWFVGGPYGGHTAATLPDGTKFEMGGKRGNGQFGGQAAGADDPSFDKHRHFPPEFFLGGDPGTTGGVSGGRSAKLGGPRVSSSSGTSGGRSSKLGGSSSGTSSSSSSAGTNGDSGTSSDGVTDVRVTNWPSDFGAATTAAAQNAVNQSPTLSGTPTPAPLGIDPLTGAPAPTGIDAANQWAAQQDFAGQFQAWGISALKSIIGEAADPFGLKSLTDMGIDRAVTAVQAQTVKVADTMNFFGYDASKIADETGRMLRDRMTPVAETYRGG
ncbi:phage tail protein [Nocardia sp. NPDC004260]